MSSVVTSSTAEVTDLGCECDAEEVRRHHLQKERKHHGSVPPDLHELVQAGL